MPQDNTTVAVDPNAAVTTVVDTTVIPAPVATDATMTQTQVDPAAVVTGTPAPEMGATTVTEIVPGPEAVTTTELPVVTTEVKTEEVVTPTV